MFRRGPEQGHRLWEKKLAVATVRGRFYVKTWNEEGKVNGGSIKWGPLPKF